MEHEEDDELLYGGADEEKESDEEKEEVSEESEKEEDVADDNSSVSGVTDIDDDDEEELIEEEDMPIPRVGIKNQLKKEIIYIDPENRKTRNILSSYELTEIISIRATQIEEHGRAFVPYADLTDAILIARRELQEGKCPLILRRCVGRETTPAGTIREFIELWDVNKMVFTF